ncbi:hypothetical protein [Cupriavidus metallidurans]|uniref:hypothetical protein n=1 Tax=Cupriavidus metallidurans TaxID=119219 RepID=UPI00131A008C|nr:hypothetical protein [Cupriavidus metallidurans]
MERTYRISIRCSLAWWVRPYVAVLKALVFVTGRMPSDAHLEKVVHRAVRTKVITAPAD